MEVWGSAVIAGKEEGLVPAGALGARIRYVLKRPATVWAGNLTGISPLEAGLSKVCQTDKKALSGRDALP